MEEKKTSFTNPKDFDYQERKVKSRTIFKGRVVTLKKDEAITTSGKTVYREYVKHHGGVCILAVNDEGKIAIVQQFRYPVGNSVLELPAGKLEQDENPREGAIRELEEEIGYRTRDLLELGSIYPCVGYSSEIIYLFLARDLIKTQTHFDDDEYIKLNWFSVEELRWMLENNMFLDGKTIVLLYKYFDMLNSQSYLDQDLD